MIKLDDNLLTSLGLATLPPEEKKKLLAHIYETLEMRVGVELAKKMTEAQLTEFEEFIKRNDEAGALKWLETNFPNYKDVVATEFEKLKVEVGQSAPQILASVQDSPQMQQPMMAPGGYPAPGGMPMPQQPTYPQQQYSPAQQPVYQQPQQGYSMPPQPQYQQPYYQPQAPQQQAPSQPQMAAAPGQFAQSQMPQQPQAFQQGPAVQTPQTTVTPDQTQQPSVQQTDASDMPQPQM